MKALLLCLFSLSAIAQTQQTVTVTGTAVVTIPAPIPGATGPMGPAGPQGPGGLDGAPGKDGVSPPSCAQDPACIAAVAAAIGAATPPTCGAAPTTTTATIACPAGYTGSWQQTTSYQSTNAPACWTAVLNPTSAPAGACTPVVVTGCAKGSGSTSTSGAYDSKKYGNYFVNNNNWGGTKGQSVWSNSPDCWGFTTTQSADIGSISSYPSVTRGWSQNATAMQAAGGNAWTVKSGMGIQVTALTKAKVHWAFQAPTTPTGIRWMGLEDIYYHKTNNPAPTEFPPVVDLMIDQSLSDQICCDTTFYGYEIGHNDGSKVTLGGNTYNVYIDAPDEDSYHQTGGHNIHLFLLPTSFDSNNQNPNFGQQNSVTDLAAITKYFMQSNPVDDAGKPLMIAHRDKTNTTPLIPAVPVTTPLIASSLYLNAINAGIEVDNITTFTNTAFCVAMQSESDCP